MSAHPRNIPAGLFQQLVSTWHADATSDRVDQLAADLAAHVAARGGPACVGIMRSCAVRRLFGLSCYLAGYGVTLRNRYTRDRSHAFIYAEIQTTTAAHEYAGAVVKESRREVAA